MWKPEVPYFLSPYALRHGWSLTETRTCPFGYTGWPSKACLLVMAYVTWVFWLLGQVQLGRIASALPQRRFCSPYTFVERYHTKRKGSRQKSLMYSKMISLEHKVTRSHFCVWLYWPNTAMWFHQSAVCGSQFAPLHCAEQYVNMPYFNYLSHEWSMSGCPIWEPISNNASINISHMHFWVNKHSFLLGLKPRRQLLCVQSMLADDVYHHFQV